MEVDENLLCLPGSDFLSETNTGRSALGGRGDQHQESPAFCCCFCSCWDHTSKAHCEDAPQHRQESRWAFPTESVLVAYATNWFAEEHLLTCIFGLLVCLCWFLQQMAWRIPWSWMYYVWSLVKSLCINPLIHIREWDHLTLTIMFGLRDLTSALCNSEFVLLGNYIIGLFCLHLE